MKHFAKVAAGIAATLAAMQASAQITASADFDNGSIGKFVGIDTMQGPTDSDDIYTLNILSRYDPLNPVDTGVAPSSRWFFFRLEGTGDKNVRVHIPNTEMRRPFYSYDGIDYTRFAQNDEGMPQTVSARFERDTVLLAYFIPYTHTRHAEELARWSLSPYTTCEVIGASGEGRPLILMTVTDDTVDDSGKKKVWIHSRVHTSEAPASWHAAGLIESLLGDSPLAAEIRRHAVFHIVPEPNPDGVAGGYSRSTPSGVNLEINWNRPDSLTAPEVMALKGAILRLTADRPMDVALNMHSQIAPHATYWIHTAESTSPSFFRREMLLSALTSSHTELFRQGAQSYSKLNPVFPEGWLWGLFGERTLALTFETPYTYYNNDPDGEWVDTDNLARFGEASLLALSDLLDLGGTERIVADSGDARQRGFRTASTDGDISFGDSYLVAKRKGATATFDLGRVEAGTYDIYKWITDFDAAHPADNDNHWAATGETVSRQRAGRLKWKFRAAAEGEKLDAILLVRRSE